MVTLLKMKEYLPKERKLLYCSKLKKGKLKTKKLLKMTMLDGQKSAVESADKTKAVQV